MWEHASFDSPMAFEDLDMHGVPLARCGNGDDKMEMEVAVVNGPIQGYICVVGSFFAMFSTFGWLNSLGLFQTYYEETLLATYSASEISWIFTFQFFLMFAGGAFFGRIIDTYGTRWVSMPCAILMTASIALMSLSTKYHQIFLSQALGFGLGSAGLFSCCMISTAQWFHKRKALALGIVAAGSGTGGIVHPIYLHMLIDKVGFASAVRWSALIIGITSTIAVLLMKTRLPPKKWDHDACFIDLSLLKQLPFTLYCIGTFLVLWGLLAPWNYLPSMAITHGFSQNMAVYSIVTLNAGSVLGRVVPPYLADSLGRFNVLSVISLLAGILFLTFWLSLEITNNSTHAQILAFGAVYGFASGAWITLIFPCCADLGSVKTLGQRFGVYQVVGGLAALTGLPIQGALISQDGGKFTHLIIFSGVCVMAGAGVLCFACMSGLGKSGSRFRG
ncbi:MFS transporter [Hyphodiscus hymeniophilus]|uniref:MFS transporter n=1 Tax=Hyphodiscus hymeniophilus TaxID=353542 RepID=A0A9P6VDM9_9HELO|nr:MFS transporter [Hyphodiscus hymeniophilus]